MSNVLQNHKPFQNCRSTQYSKSSGVQMVRVYPYKDLENDIKLTNMSLGKWWLSVKEKRFLNKDEYVAYKDNDNTNYDFSNLYISKKDIRHNSVVKNKKLGKVPL